MKKNKKNKSKLSSIYNKYKENPRELIKNIYLYSKKKIENNKLFVAYLVINVFNTILLRSLTLGTGTILDFDPVLMDLSLIIFFGSINFLFNEKGRFKYLFALTIIFSIICVINSSYYTFYTSFSSIAELTRVKFITQVGDAVIENVFQPKDLLYLLAPILLIFLYKSYSKQPNYARINRKNGKKFKKTLIVSAIAFALFLSTVKPLDVGRLVKQWNREYIVKKFGIYSYHINDLVKSVKPKFASLFGYDQAVKGFKEFYLDYNHKTKNKYTNMFKGKNIIAIHAESIQNFVIGLEFNGKEVTPNLNKLTKEGYYFNNFYSQVSIGTSSDTEFTLNTSLMPANIGTAFTDYYDKEYVSIPKLLKEQDYYSFAMHGNNGEYWNRRKMHANLGYDSLFAKDTYLIDETIGLGISDESFFKQSIEKLKKINEEKKNFYGTIITLTNHTPFSEAEKYGEFPVDIKEMVKDEFGNYVEKTYPYMEGTKLGNYFKSVHYSDYALGVFLDGLEKEGLLENTVIILYGDHDARLPKKDYDRLYNYDKETDGIKDIDDETYYDFNSHEYELNRKVPFIIWSKKTKENPAVFNYPMGMSDVMPTLGNMFGFYNPYALGKDIFNTKEKNLVVFPNGDWINKDAYYNHNKQETYLLGKIILNQEKIDSNNVLADQMMTVSNNIMVYDLIKNTREKQIDESAIIGEKNEK